jgi:hypothetical protein
LKIAIFYRTKQSNLWKGSGVEARNWRHAALPGKEDGLTPRYYGEPFIPYAPFHHFKFRGGSQINSFDNRFHRYLK